MQGKVYEIPLDIANGVLTSQIRALVTEDMGTNTFRFKVVRDNHVPYDFTGTIVRMIVKTPSGARIQQECTIENAIGGTVSLTLKQSLLLEHGSYIAELQIFDAITQSIRLTTPTFDYHVRQSLQNSESIVATDEYTILQEALADLAGINIVVANKADKSDVGDVEDLGTDDKTNLVSAINEVKAQSNEMATNQTTHEAKVVSHGLGVTRSVGVDGIQVMALPFKAKSIIVFASIDTTKMMSNGFWAENGYQRGKAVAGDTGTLISTAEAVGLYSSDANRFEGLIQNVTEAGFEIKWTTNGSFTGTVSVYAIASTH